MSRQLRTVQKANATPSLPARKESHLSADGAYVFQDELAGAPLLTMLVTTCEAWLLELFEIRSGEVLFAQTGPIEPLSTRFAIFYPPFSLTQPVFRNVAGRMIGVAAIASLPDEFSKESVVFKPVTQADPQSVSDVVDLLETSGSFQSVDLRAQARPLTQKAKALIDANYLQDPSIARIAAQLGVSHAHLSRQFRRDFTVSPSSYLRQLRVADAPFRLARGEKIIDVSHEVGYNDLSRFYKQFRETTNSSPGNCKKIMRSSRH